jgi:HlyD family secretion protein
MPSFEVAGSAPRPRRRAGSARGVAVAALAAAVAVLSPAGSPLSLQLVSGAAAADRAPYVAAAPGRVEARGGAVNIGAPQVGRVADVLIAVNDKVEEGELLVRLDDAEFRAKLAAAETAAGSAMRDRDAANLSSSRADVRKAEDDVYDAERAVTGARIELDEMLRQRRSGENTARDVEDARRRLTDARARLKKERSAVAKAQGKSNLAEPSRAESVLSTARAEVAISDAMLDKTRIRAPRSGTVLEVNAKVGEIVAPTPELPMVVVGDLAKLQVKTEVSESDISRIRIGQKAFVKTPAFPGREFEGTVSALAPTLAAPKLGARGPRRPTDVDVLEVTIEVDGETPLLPGMRVDAFFRGT